MNTIVVLTVILFMLMKWIGGHRGVRSFFSLLLNFIVLYISILLIARNGNPLPVTLCACVLISAISLFLINQVNDKTKAAFFSTLITLGILIFFIYKIGLLSRLQGFGEEEYDDLSAYSLYIRLDFMKIMICTVLMGMIGAVTDIAISIASAMNEIYLNNREITGRKLFEAGMNVGRDILGTTANTLYFAFIGGYMALLLWFKDLDYSFEEIINSKVFGSELLQILCSGLGVTVIIPITAGLVVLLLMKSKNTEDQRKDREE